MPQPLKFSLQPTANERGDSEETATTGRLVITANRLSMTEGIDTHVGEIRPGPEVSGYYLAEWLTWNWWRLRWEPPKPLSGGRSDLNSTSTEMVRNWAFAHCMSTIGHGFDWPNVTIGSDGYMTEVTSEPSAEPEAVSYRYIGRSTIEVVRGDQLEEAIDLFVAEVLSLLRTTNVRESNLQRLWDDLAAERTDVAITRFRRLEAKLGVDPDEIEEQEINRHLKDAATLGENALEEIAAHASERGQGLNLPRASELENMAKVHGFHANRRNAVRMSPEARENLPDWGEVAAWRVGMAAADELRKQEKLGSDPIENGQLAELAGTGVNAITNIEKHIDEFSFLIGKKATASRVVLRPKWETGRRFELARLIGDRLFPTKESLCPATRAHSYRQKVQRAFAAQFLGPWEAVEQMLQDDDSEDRENEIANHFQVSPLTIRNQVENNRPAPRRN